MAISFRSVLILASLALAGGVGCKGSDLGHGDGGNDASEPSILACTVATDCTRSEINHEILTPADCICLYGCPFEIMNVETATRRNAQYLALCTPGKDAHGQPCGIDDCIQPAPLACADQMCVALGAL